MNLKQYFIDYNLHRFLKKQKFEPDQSDTEGKGIGILFLADSLIHQQLGTQFQEKIQVKSKEHVHLFGYVPKHLDKQVTFAFPHFSMSDVSLKPDFSRHKLSLFMQRRYRLLINLDLENHRIIHYVLSQINATYKMAISPEYTALYNIIVSRDQDDDMPFLFDKTLDIFEKTLAI